ncbi:hypothetical protein I0E98_18005 [Pseudomonas lalucatii]|nr:hypothetical protein [Pseudomonas lalucatii]
MFQQDLGLSGISEAEIVDVIKRCRLLRKLPNNEARRHVWAMGTAIAEALDKFRPSLVLSLTIDSYVMDLLRLLAQTRGVRFVGFIGTFVNGYYRVSARGEPNFNSAADLSIVPELKAKLLKDDYAPAFNVKSLSRPRRSVYRRWAANVARVPYFWLKRLAGGDYYNYHYWVSQLISTEQFHLYPPSDPGDALWTQRLCNVKRPSLFIPLQMFPECTVDYWCQDVRVIDYYETLNQLVEKLATRFHVVIKEHPSVMGSRPGGFYAALSRDERVTVVPTYVPSNEVLRSVDGVVVWTGSVGFESMLRGKPVFGLASPFYASGDRFRVIDKDPDIEAMLRHVEVCKAKPVTEDEQEAMLTHLARQLFKGDFINDGSWTLNNPQHVSQAERVVQSFIQCEFGLPL